MKLLVGWVVKFNTFFTEPTAVVKFIPWARGLRLRLFSLSFQTVSSPHQFRKRLYLKGAVLHRFLLVPVLHLGCFHINIDQYHYVLSFTFSLEEPKRRQWMQQHELLGAEVMLTGMKTTRLNMQVSGGRGKVGSEGHAQPPPHLGGLAFGCPSLNLAYWRMPTGRHQQTK